MEMKIKQKLEKSVLKCVLPVRASFIAGILFYIFK